MRQPDAAIAAARAAFPGDPWSIAALHVVTTLTGSALLALALAHGVREPAEIWTAAHVDEDFNIEQWGLDEEVAARRAARLVDFEAATRILKAMKGWVEVVGLTRGLRRSASLPANETSRMAISVTPVLPVLPAQEVAAVTPELVLQPGTTIDATVLKVLSADLVRIVIASLSVDVKTEIPLQQGQTLKLAVSQTATGIRLTNVDRRGDTAADAVTLSPDALLDAPLGAFNERAAKTVLTPLEKVTVTIAAQTAATEQGSQAPLFANLAGIAGSAALPPKLLQAVQQVLAQQTGLDPDLSGARYQVGVPEIRVVSGGLARRGLSTAGGRSRSEGRAARAAADAAVGARRQGRGHYAPLQGRCGADLGAVRRTRARAAGDSAAAGEGAGCG